MTLNYITGLFEEDRDLGMISAKARAYDEVGAARQNMSFDERDDR